MSPAEILDAAGSWLAAELGGGFRWVKSRQTVARSLGPRTEELRLQPSTWNRAGQSTQVTLRVTIRDKDLEAWRRNHLDGTLLSHPSQSSLLWTSEFINVNPDLYFVVLFGPTEDQPGVSYVSLAELAERVQRRILPRLAAFDLPSKVANDVPDTWLVLVAPIVEWAVSLGDSGAARTIITRAMRKEPRQTGSFEEGMALFEKGERPAYALGEAAVGWLAARHRLFADSEPLPWTVPVTSGEDRVIATGRNLVEQIRAELRHLPEYRESGAPDRQLRDALRFTQRWLVELTDPSVIESPSPDRALTYRVTEFWVPQPELGRRLIEFERAAVEQRRRRRQQTASE